jgi:hypothetical protein
MLALWKWSASRRGGDTGRKVAAELKSVRSRADRVVRRYRYSLLLAVVFALLLWLEMAPPTIWTLPASALLLGATLLLALWRPGISRGTLRLAQVSLVVAVLAGVLVIEGEVGTGLALASAALLTAVSAVAILNGLVRDISITLQSIMGALSVYLLIGIFFATLDQSFSALSRQPFFAFQPAAARPDFVYFSFVTLATVGFGDLVPSPRGARMLTIIEALFGQLYLVTVVALLVTNVGRQRR